jgi:hypothetical protein
MSPDYSKRHYLLPKGCKDLIDVLNLQTQRPDPPSSDPLTPIIGEIVVSHNTSVGEFAVLLARIFHS